jgi:hypothetical protein
MQISGTLAWSCSRTFVRSVQKRKTRADDDDNGEDGEDISNALNTSITDLVDHNALAK